MELQERQGPIAGVSTTTTEVWLSYWEEKEGRETREVAQRQLEEVLKWTWRRKDGDEEFERKL